MLGSLMILSIIISYFITLVGNSPLLLGQSLLKSSSPYGEEENEVTITRNRIFIHKLFTLSTADKNWLNSGKDLVAICEEIIIFTITFEWKREFLNNLKQVFHLLKSLLSVTQNCWTFLGSWLLRIPKFKIF